MKDDVKQIIKVIVYIASILIFLVGAKLLTTILATVAEKQEIFGVVIFIAFITFYFICRKRGVFKDTFKKKDKRDK